MFINEIQKLIWAPATQEYQETYNKYSDYFAIELYQDILHAVNEIPVKQNNNPFYKAAIFITSGCPYRINQKEISGCTFCNFMTPYVSLLAKCALLKEKDSFLYTQIIKHSINICENAMSNEPFILFFSGFDTFSESEMPDEVFSILEKSKFFKSKTIKLIGIETRAKSLTKSKLEKLKTLTQIPLGINIGVEVGDEWLRNHWINKDISDNDIDDAVKLIKDQNYQLSVSILLGIPGLSQKQSIQLFIETFSLLWQKYHPDTIMCGPLINKTYTIQNTLYKMNNDTLAKSGVTSFSNKQYFSVFAFYEALFHAIYYNDDARYCIRLFEGYLKSLSLEDNKTKEERFLADLIIMCVKKNDFYPFIAERKQIVKMESYHQFKRSLEKQDSLENIKQTLWNTSYHIVNALVAEDKKEDLLLEFKKELDQYRVDFTGAINVMEL